MAKSCGGGGETRSAELVGTQIALLLLVYMTKGPHTVRVLAKTLSVSKPAITRAIDQLSDLEMVRRKPDEDDRRSILVQRTVKGYIFLREYGEIIFDTGKTIS